MHRGASCVIPDTPISQQRHTRTSTGPALVTYAGTLCVACKSGSSVGMWYALFDGTSWLAQDIGITTDGTVKTGHGPALAAMNPCLVMVYRDDRQAI